MKFSKKLTLIFGVLFVLFGVLISAVLYYSDVRALEVKEKEHLSEHALHVMDKIDRMLFERYADIQVLSTDPVISSRGSTPAQIKERLQAFQTAYKTYASLSFFDMNRVRIADTSGEKIGEQRKLVEYWIDLAEGKEFVVNLHKSITLNKIVIHFVQVVKDKKGIPFGVVVSRTPVDELNEIVEKAEATHKPGEFKVELLDRNGLILYSSKNKGAILKDTSEEWEIMKKYIASGTKSGVIKYTNQKEDTGEEILSFAHESGYRGYKGNDWTLVLETPTSIAFASAIELKNRIIIVMLICSVLVLFLIYLLSNKISQSIEKMTDAADEISKGNLDVRVEITSKDETGRLAEAFNRMTSDLKEQRDKLLSYSSELEDKVLKRTSELKGISDRLQVEIIDRNKAFEALQMNKDLLQSVIDNSTAVIYIKDLDGKYVLVNKWFETLFRLSREEVIGKNDYDIFPKEIADVLRENDKMVLGCRHSVELEEVVLQDEKPHNYISVKFPLSDLSGKFYAVCGISTDITERKKMEDKNKKQVDELQRWYNVMLDREYRVIELKREVNELLGKTGQQPRYPSVET